MSALDEVIEYLSDPVPVDVSDLMVRVWAESTTEDAEDGYTRQARIIAAVLDREVNRFEVVNAMEACAAIHKLQAGDDLVEMYGAPNTDLHRDAFLDGEQQNLAVAVLALGGNR